MRGVIDNEEKEKKIYEREIDVIQNTIEQPKADMGVIHHPTHQVPLLEPAQLNLRKYKPNLAACDMFLRGIPKTNGGTQ